MVYRKLQLEKTKQTKGNYKKQLIQKKKEVKTQIRDHQKTKG